MKPIKLQHTKAKAVTWTWEKATKKLYIMNKKDGSFDIMPGLFETKNAAQKFVDRLLLEDECK